MSAKRMGGDQRVELRNTWSIYYAIIFSLVGYTCKEKFHVH